MTQDMTQPKGLAGKVLQQPGRLTRHAFHEPLLMGRFPRLYRGWPFWAAR